MKKKKSNNKLSINKISSKKKPANFDFMTKITNKPVVTKQEKLEACMYLFRYGPDIVQNERFSDVIGIVNILSSIGDYLYLPHKNEETNGMSDREKWFYEVFNKVLYYETTDWGKDKESAGFWERKVIDIFKTASFFSDCIHFNDEEFLKVFIDVVRHLHNPTNKTQADIVSQNLTFRNIIQMFNPNISDKKQKEILDNWESHLNRNDLKEWIEFLRGKRIAPDKPNNYQKVSRQEQDKCIDYALDETSFSKRVKEIEQIIGERLTKGKRGKKKISYEKFPIVFEPVNPSSSISSEKRKANFWSWT